MSFIDNPVIASLGANLGLGGVFAAAGGQPPPGEAPMPPEEMAPPASGDGPPPKIGKSAANIPVYKGRPYIPKNEMGSQAGGVRPGVGGMNPITPGAMDPAVYDDPNMKALLGHYGVQPPTAPPDPNLFIHSPAAFEKHPIVSGLLERGLEGLAYAHPGQNFFQSLIGGVQGMQEANAARGAQVNAQTSAPLNQALAMSQLQQKYDEHTSSVDMQTYHTGMLAHQKAQDDLNATKEDDRNNKALNVAPRLNNETGEWMKLGADPNSGSGYSWQVAPELGRDEEKYQIGQYLVNSMKDLANKKYGGDITKITPMEHLQGITEMERQRSLAKGAAAILNTNTRAAASTANTQARINAPSKSGGGRGAGASGRPGDLTPQQHAQVADFVKQETLLNKRIDTAVKTSSVITGPDGHMMAPGSTAHIQYINGMKQELATIRQRKLAIIGGSPSSPAAAPTWSPNNPFPH